MIASILLALSTYKAWGIETIELIRKEIYLPEQRLYAEDSERSQVAFNWPAGVMLSALNGAASLDERYKPWLAEYADQMRAQYWRQEGGFDVLPMPKPADRYYDDNAWMGLALLETAQVLSNDKYLRWAEETAQFVLTGEDERLGGGIYWRESDKASKNTCSNAPSALLLTRLYALTKRPRHLADATRLYIWTRRNLRDPATYLYWDNISAKGKVEKTTWSYNTALMIRTAIELHKITGNKEFQNDAQRSLDAAVPRWLDAESGLIKDDMAFAHLLFEAFAEAGDHRLDRAIDSLYKLARDSKGGYGGRWDNRTPQRNKWRLIDLASAARAYFVAARRS